MIVNWVNDCDSKETRWLSNKLPNLIIKTVNLQNFLFSKTIKSQSWQNTSLILLIWENCDLDLHINLTHDLCQSESDDRSLFGKGPEIDFLINVFTHLRSKIGIYLSTFLRRARCDPNSVNFIPISSRASRAGFSAWKRRRCGFSLGPHFSLLFVGITRRFYRYYENKL